VPSFQQGCKRRLKAKTTTKVEESCGYGKVVIFKRSLAKNSGKRFQSSKKNPWSEYKIGPPAEGPPGGQKGHRSQREHREIGVCLEGRGEGVIE